MSALDNNAVQQAFIGVTNIEASSITAVICGIGASRRLQGTGGGGSATRELLFTYELAIPMEVKTKDMNDASVEALASAIRDSTVAQLKLSSESGSFIESLQQNYIQQREFTLSSDIAASSVEVQFAPTAAPTMDPGSSPASSQSGISLSLSTIIMAAVAAAIGILVAVIIYCRYYYLFQSTTSKRAKISPRNVSYSMDDEEEEEIQSTMYESPRHNLDHSSRYDNGSPLVVRIDSGRDSSSEEEEDEHAADLISSVSTPKASPVLRRPLHSPDESTQMKTPPGGAALFKQEWLSATKIIDGNIEETGMMSGGSGSLRQSKSSRHSGASRRVRQETRQQSDDVSRSDSSNGSRKAPSHALANPNPTEAVVIPGTGNVTEQDMYDVSMVDKSVVRIIHSGSVELRLHACIVARKASSISSQRKDLTRPELGLLPALLHILREDGMDSCKINALGTIRNLVTDEACAIQWIQHDTGLLEILSFGLGKALRECMRKEQTRQGVIPNGRYDGSSASMQHFFETFNASSGKDSEETEVLLAAGVLKNLSVITSNAVQIAAPALGLLEVLIEFVKWGDASTKTVMLSILANLVKQTQSPFARLVRADNEEFALLLVYSLKCPYLKMQTKSLDILKYIAKLSNIALLLTAAHIDLLPSLVQFIASDGDVGGSGGRDQGSVAVADNRAHQSLEVISSLLQGNSINRHTLCNPASGLVEALMNTVRPAVRSRFLGVTANQVLAVASLGRLCIARENSVYLTRAGLLDLLKVLAGAKQSSGQKLSRSEKKNLQLVCHNARKAVELLQGHISAAMLQTNGTSSGR